MQMPKSIFGSNESMSCYYIPMKGFALGNNINAVPGILLAEICATVLYPQ